VGFVLLGEDRARRDEDAFDPAEHAERMEWIAEQPGGAEALEAYRNNVAEHGDGPAAVHAAVGTAEGREAIIRLT
jgi:hypothetical protein